MATAKEYSNGRIAVIWDSTKCIHSANCIKGLPSVFNSNRRPWIQIKGADSNTIINQVEKCPSGALTYRELSPDEVPQSKHSPIVPKQKSNNDRREVKRPARTDIPQSFSEPPVKPERRRGIDAPPRSRRTPDQNRYDGSRRDRSAGRYEKGPDRQPHSNDYNRHTSDRQPYSNDRSRQSSERQPYSSSPDRRKPDRRPPTSRKTPVNRDVEKEFIFDSDDQRNFISADQELPPTSILDMHTKVPGRKDNRTQNGNSGIKLEITDNGPMIIKGNIEIKHKDGRIENKKGANAFCRCGESGNKPFCDGSHNGFDFDF